MPSRVHLKHGRYYYVQSIKGKKVWTALSRVDEGDHALYAALAKHLSAPVRTIAELLDAFLTDGAAELRPKTLKNYRSYLPRLKAVFGHMDPDAVEPTHVAQYLEARKRGGAAVNGNREVELLSSAYSYGMRHQYATTNPCRFVRRNRQSPRRRYIPHEEFLEAFNRAPEEFQDFLALAYLTGLRQKDLRELTRAQLTAEGIVVDESKTGKRRVVGWSDSLRWFINRACARSAGDHVLLNSRGDPWGEWAVQSAMRRLGVAWTLHQVRHKAETDHRDGMGLLPLYRRITRHGATR